MAYGYNGIILRVDLSTGQISAEELAENVYREYLGGPGLAAYLLLREMTAGADPLGPDNILAFVTSVLVGTPGAGLNRLTVSAKSPLTGGWGESQAGGWFGPELKFAGFDGIVIKGQAKQPVYLWIHDGEAEIRDGTRFWGADAGEAQEGIRQELGDKRARIALIGPAGERLVRFASIANELRHFNGRTGLGAVMGSKNLKAIAVRGSKKVDLADPEGVKAALRWFKDHYERKPGDSHDLGTAGGVMALNALGLLPTRNFSSGAFEGAEEISGERMKETILKGRGSCWGCPIWCKRVVQFDNAYSVDPSYGGPEYETIGAFGSVCGIADLQAVAKAHELCGKYGMDTISTGMSIAFAMECFEHGLLNRQETGGIDLRSGNPDAMLKMVEMIGERKGLGDLLAEGPIRAAGEIGKGAEAYALHVKGQYLPMHEPRGKVGVGLAYALSPTGADHLEAPHDEDLEQPGETFKALAPLGLLEPLPAQDLSSRKVRQFVYLQQLWNLHNNIGLCMFAGVPYGPWSISKLLDYTRAVTGWDISLWELMKSGERMGVLARVFQVREGISPRQDTLPARLFKPLEGGALEGAKIDKAEFDGAIRTYYEMVGWNPDTGVPTRGKLEELNVGWAADLPGA